MLGNFGFGLAGRSGKAPAAGGGVPVVSAVSYGVVDTAGGGQRVVVTVDNSTGCTAISAGGVAFTSFAIDDATHVSGIPGAHAAGVVDVVVTNATGPSTTGTGLIEYWLPSQITSVDAYWDSNKGVTLTGSNVTTWADQSATGRSATQAAATAPTLVSSVFGTLPAVRYVPQQRMVVSPRAAMAVGLSFFAVVKWTSTDATGSATASAPLAICGDQTNGYNGFGASAGSIEYVQYVAGNQRVTRGASLNDGVTRLVGATHDHTSSDIKLYSGVTQQGATGNHTYYTGYNGYDVLGNAYLSADGWDGDIGAIIATSGVISSGDHTKLHGWARQRFGAQ